MSAELQQKSSERSFKKTTYRFFADFRDTLKLWYGLFLKNIALKLFLNPDNAIKYAYNALPKTSSMMVGNYCMGFLLGGDDTGELLWGIDRERAVIFPETAHISKRLRSYMRRDEYEIRYNTNFDEVSVHANEKRVCGLLNRSFKFILN